MRLRLVWRLWFARVHLGLLYDFVEGLDEGGPAGNLRGVGCVPPLLNLTILLVSLDWSGAFLLQLELGLEVEEKVHRIGLPVDDVVGIVEHPLLGGVVGDFRISFH